MESKKSYLKEEKNLGNHSKWEPSLVLAPGLRQKSRVKKSQLLYSRAKSQVLFRSAHEQYKELFSHEDVSKNCQEFFKWMVIYGRHLPEHNLQFNFKKHK